MEYFNNEYTFLILSLLPLSFSLMFLNSFLFSHGTGISKSVYIYIYIYIYTHTPTYVPALVAKIWDIPTVNIVTTTKDKR